MTENGNAALDLKKIEYQKGSGVDVAAEAVMLSDKPIGVYETKYHNAQEKIVKTNFSPAETVMDALQGSDVSEKNTPVLEAIEKGLKESQVATIAALGVELENPEELVALKNQDVYSSSLVARKAMQNAQITVSKFMRKRISEDDVETRVDALIDYRDNGNEFRYMEEIDALYDESNAWQKAEKEKLLESLEILRADRKANYAPFVVEAVMDRIGCGKDEAAKRVIETLAEVQDDWNKEIIYTEGKKNQVCFYEAAMNAFDSAKETAHVFAANCGVDGVQEVVDSCIHEKSAAIIENEKRIEQYNLAKEAKKQQYLAQQNQKTA